MSPLRRRTLLKPPAALLPSFHLPVGKGSCLPQAADGAGRAAPHSGWDAEAPHGLDMPGCRCWMCGDAHTGWALRGPSGPGAGCCGAPLPGRLVPGRARCCARCCRERADVRQCSAEPPLPPRPPNAALRPNPPSQKQPASRAEKSNANVVAPGRWQPRGSGALPARRRLRSSPADAAAARRPCPQAPDALRPTGPQKPPPAPSRWPRAPASPPAAARTCCSEGRLQLCSAWESRGPGRSAPRLPPAPPFLPAHPKRKQLSLLQLVQMSSLRNVRHLVCG